MMADQLNHPLESFRVLKPPAPRVVRCGLQGFQLGEHNDFHKQTNFELATRFESLPL